MVGGSTKYLSNFLNKYYSIEHNKLYCDLHINQSNIITFYEPDHYKYIIKPQELNITYDKVLINGLNRPSCGFFIKNDTD